MSEPTNFLGVISDQSSVKRNRSLMTSHIRMITVLRPGSCTGREDFFLVPIWLLIAWSPI